MDLELRYISFVRPNKCDEWSGSILLHSHVALVAFRESEIKSNSLCVSGRMYLILLSDSAPRRKCTVASYAHFTPHVEKGAQPSRIVRTPEEEKSEIELNCSRVSL